MFTPFGSRAWLDLQYAMKKNTVESDVLSDGKRIFVW